MSGNVDGKNEQFTRLKYYEFARDEIKREDDLTNQRISSSLTFQGFLTASAALIVAETAQKSGIGSLHVSILIFLFAIGVFGFFLAVATFLGVKAARDSLHRTRVEWWEQDKNWGLRAQKLVPEITGHAPDHEKEKHIEELAKDNKDKRSWMLSLTDFGSYYSLMIPALFVVMWVLYLIYVCCFLLKNIFFNGSP